MNQQSNRKQTSLITRIDTDQNHASDHSEGLHLPVSEKEAKPRQKDQENVTDTIDESKGTKQEPEIELNQRNNESFTSIPICYYQQFSIGRFLVLMSK